MTIPTEGGRPVKPPSARRRSREFAMQGVYQWIFTGAGHSDILKNLSELDDFGKADNGFLTAELRGTINEAEGLREKLEPLARGRVWTGSDAHARGLVDQLGGMGAALDLAADRAGLDPERLTVRRVPALPWLEQLRPADSSESGSLQASGTPSMQRLLTGGPEDRLVALAQLAGVELPGGVLSLPWRLQIG